jgi:hypothetical protein
MVKIASTSVTPMTMPTKCRADISDHLAERVALINAAIAPSGSRTSAHSGGRAAPRLRSRR